MPCRKTQEQFIAEAKAVHGDRYDYSKSVYTGAKSKLVVVCAVHGDFPLRADKHLAGAGCPYCSGALYNTVSYINKAKEIHGDKYDYRCAEFITSHTKSIIICPTHGEFPQTPNSHLSGQGCPSCSPNAKDTTESFIRKAKAVHGGIYDYSQVDYTNSQTEVKIVCKEHGEFPQTPSKHLFGQGCPKCSGRYKTTEEFILEAKAVHGDRYNYSNLSYRTATAQVDILCSTHGQFSQQANNHLLGFGCIDCGFDNLRSNKEEFVTKARLVHGDRYIYDCVDYLDSKAEVSIVCSEHGSFQQKPNSHLSGYGCPKCAKYGFHTQEKAIFYIYSFGEFVGFGITNNFKKRHTTHLKTFKKCGIEATLLKTFDMPGQQALDLETDVKRTMNIINTGIDGFKTEAIHSDDLPLLIKRLKII